MPVTAVSQPGWEIGTNADSWQTSSEQTDGPAETLPVCQPRRAGAAAILRRTVSLDIFYT